jgi:hypothetical protein
MGPAEGLSLTPANAEGASNEPVHKIASATRTRQTVLMVVSRRVTVLRTGHSAYGLAQEVVSTPRRVTLKALAAAYCGAPHRPARTDAASRLLMNLGGSGTFRA